MQTTSGACAAGGASTPGSSSSMNAHWLQAIAFPTTGGRGRMTKPRKSSDWLQAIALPDRRSLFQLQAIALPAAGDRTPSCKRSPSQLQAIVLPAAGDRPHSCKRSPSQLQAIALPAAGDRPTSCRRSHSKLQAIALPAAGGGSQSQEREATDSLSRFLREQSYVALWLHSDVPLDVICWNWMWNAGRPWREIWKWPQLVMIWCVASHKDIIFFRINSTAKYSSYSLFVRRYIVALSQWRAAEAVVLAVWQCHWAEAVVEAVWQCDCARVWPRQLFRCWKLFVK